MITIEDILTDLDRACLAHIAQPGPGTASDAAIVVRRIARYLDEAAGGGLGAGIGGQERARVTEHVASVASRTVRALDLPLQPGRAADLAGIALDALRTSRPPMGTDERWAIACRLQQPLALAASVLTRDTDSPEPVRLYDAARAARQRADLDPPSHDALVRLDDVIPPPADNLAPGQAVAPGQYADRLSALGAAVRAGLETRSMTVGDAITVAETALAVSDACRRIYLAAGMPDLSDGARAGAQAWADLRVHLCENVSDGLGTHPTSAVGAQAAALHRTVLAVALDPGLATRNDLPGQMAHLGRAAGRLPELAGWIASRAQQWDTDGGLLLRRGFDHPSFSQGPYRGSQWAPSGLAAADGRRIRDLAEAAARGSAALSVELEKREMSYPPATSGSRQPVPHRPGPQDTGPRRDTRADGPPRPRQTRRATEAAMARRRATAARPRRAVPTAAPTAG